MGTQKNSRKSLRAPLYIDVNFRLACGTLRRGKIINLSTGGVFIKVDELVGSKERITVRFSLPSISKPMQLKGQVVWSRSYLKHKPKFEVVNVMGVKFVSVREKYRQMIKDYILQAIHMDAKVRSHGISLVMGKIRKLPPADRLKAYDLLINRGHATLNAAVPAATLLSC
jgi:Tfp pilus assembly protein PilZ